MIALAFGPGSVVLISGAFMRSLAGCQSLPLPPRRRPRVLEDDATGVELGTDAIGFEEIPVAAGGAAGLDELQDFLDRDRRLLVFEPAQGQDAEDAVEALERRAHGGRISHAQLA